MNISASQLVWTLVCTALVLLMQVGFGLLESGSTRSKNSCNVAIKNICDLALAGLLFWFCGFGFMFGDSYGGFIGVSGFCLGEGSSPETILQLVFQMAFCATAATIVSGAVAERMRFGAYIGVAGIITAFLYPLFGHWAWATDGAGSANGWLAQLGYIDLAGSSVVHAAGGWSALAVVVVLGARIGRFHDQNPTKIQGHNLALSTLGVIILWCGWLGFNGGSVPLGDRTPMVFLNTVLAASSGLLTALAAVKWFEHQWSITSLLNGSLAGLVGICAACDQVSPSAAMMIGAISAILAYSGENLLVSLKIDDVVGAVPVHAFAGTWGTIAVALFISDDAIPETSTRVSLLGVQLIGAVVCAVWFFGGTFVFAHVLKRLGVLRCDTEAEQMGLNVSEHGAGNEILDLLFDMERHRKFGDLSFRVHEEPHTEIGQFARRYNEVLDSVQTREENLVIAKRDADASNVAKSQFLANMSHELRTPMTSILGYTDLISEAPDGHKLPAESALALQTIRRNGEHLLGLINDILDLSKIESGNLETEAIRCSLSELMNEVTRTMGTMAKGKNLKFGVEYATKIPREIRTDPTRLKQILFNVIGNSLKFTKNGSVTVTVRYETSPIHFVIDIADTGIGLTEEQRKGLFRPFSQADASTTRQYGGTGLGLSISRYLAEALGGSLVLHHTEPGVGSCFRLCIQADYPSESEWFVPIDETQKNNVAAGRTTKSELELAGLRILVAEDGLDNQRLIRHILSKRGATVEVVENGALAVQRVQEEVLNQTAFDVVLMDMQMPVMDGYAATATLRSQHYQLPVIALTANAMHGDREKCLKAGCSDFATKPIDRTALIAIILNSISDSSRSHTSEVTKS